MSSSSSSSSSSYSAYELARLANIERNRQHLEALGLGKAKRGMQLKPRVKKKRAPRPRPTKKKRKRTASTPTNHEENSNGRKSRRLQGRSALSSGLNHDWEEVDDDDEDIDKVEARWPLRPESDVFGALPLIPVGFGFTLRAEACTAGIHRATVAGIVGRPDDGCFSIVLNGGYADDIDEGSHLTYTGSGGRSLKGTAGNPKNLRTGPHTKHQTMDGPEGRKNRALRKSLETKKPVRVVRGYKLESKFAPLGIDYGGEVNYRYDGLYQVVKMWTSQGIDHSFNVFKFALIRLPNQSELPIREDLVEGAKK